MRHLSLAAIAAFVFSLTAGTAGTTSRPATLVYSSLSRFGTGEGANPETVADLYIIRTDGKVLRRLTRNSLWDGDPSWSPDGGRIAFSKGEPICNSNSCESGQSTGSIWVRSLNGAKARRLTNDAGIFVDQLPTWSPDGRTIAFVRTDAGGDPRDGIYTVGANGRGLKRIDQRDPIAIDWSPDGSTLAFIHGDGWLGLLDVATDEATRIEAVNLPSVRSDVAWSPSGKKLAVATRLGIYVIGVEGGHARRVAGARYPAGVTWSPDGRRLAFSAAKGPDREARNDLYIVGVNGRGLIRLTTNAGPDLGPDWRP